MIQVHVTTECAIDSQNDSSDLREGFPAPGDSHVSIRKGCDQCTESQCGS